MSEPRRVTCISPYDRIRELEAALEHTRKLADAERRRAAVLEEAARRAYQHAAALSRAALRTAPGPADEGRVRD